MDRLADEERLVLEWKYLDRLAVRDMADRLGRTEKSVESILYRARRSFRSAWERLGGGDRCRRKA
jgi:DNA-directed RNA polymerase specialized sigma24 family protein